MGDARWAAAGDQYRAAAVNVICCPVSAIRLRESDHPSRIAALQETGEKSAETEQLARLGTSRVETDYPQCDRLSG